MPELPEVETVRRGLAPVMEGIRIDQADVNRPDLRWPFPEKLKIKLTADVLIPLLAFGRKDFPTRTLGLGSISVPSSCAKQWAQWMRHPDYLFANTFNIDTSNYTKLKQPLLSLGFDDDEIAPEVNIDEILKHFASANIEKRFLDVSTLSIGAIGHSGFFREKAKETLWAMTLDWYEAPS